MIRDKIEEVIEGFDKWGRMDIEKLRQILTELDKVKGARCICGELMKVFTSNFGGHEGQYCLVCTDMYNSKKIHMESKWYDTKPILEQALKTENKDEEELKEQPDKKGQEQLSKCNFKTYNGICSDVTGGEGHCVDCNKLKGKPCDVCEEPATKYCFTGRAFAVCGKPLCDKHDMCKKCSVT